MKLTDEVKKYWKVFRDECDYMLCKGKLLKAIAEEQIPMVDAVLDAFDAIEALQQENAEWQKNYDELDAGHSRLFKAFCGLKQENEQLHNEQALYFDIDTKRTAKVQQLQAQVAQYREMEQECDGGERDE